MNYYGSAQKGNGIAPDADPATDPVVDPAMVSQIFQNKICSEKETISDALHARRDRGDVHKIRRRNAIVATKSTTTKSTHG